MDPMALAAELSAESFALAACRFASVSGCSMSSEGTMFG